MLPLWKEVTVPSGTYYSGICMWHTCLHLLGVGTSGDSFQPHLYWPCRNISTESGTTAEWGRDRQSK